ncbi:TPA: hypothetical protein ACQN09_001517 [Streptococcus pyogenes]|nr:hypothetical protein [Streptococcus pyogenes]
MKKIDLHIHTQECKQGDGKKRVISPEDFVKKMRENNVEICSITNHNKFDIDEFRKIRTLDEELTIFPGMEIDVMLPESNHRHIIVIGNPDDAEIFDDVFDDSDRDYDSHIIDYDEFIAKVKSFKTSDIMVIPHFYLKDKQRGITEEEANKLREDLEGYIVILEPRSIQAMGIINAHNDLALFGSDVKDWGEYDKIILPEIKYKIDSFAKFYALAVNPSLFVKNILEETKKYGITKYEGSENFKSLSSPVEIFEDINIVFGEKGSGKTIFVKNYIYPTLKGLGKKVFLHEGKDYNAEYQKVIDELGNKVIIDSEQLNEIKQTIKMILEYQESNNYDGLQQILEFNNSQLKNKNAAKIQKRNVTVSSISNIEAVQSTLREAKSQYNKIDDVKLINDTTARESSSNKDNLDKDLELLKSDIFKNTKDSIKDYFSNKGTIQTVNSIKDSIKKQTGSDSKPTHIGFSDLVARRLGRVKNNQRLITLLREVKKSQINSLGVLPQKGKVKLKTEIKVLSEAEIYKTHSDFDRNGIVARRKLMKKFNHFDINSGFHDINKYFDVSEKATNVDDFVGKIIKRFNKVNLENSQGQLKNYEPSEGEKAILSISAILENNQFDFYIFDEIERGLGNYYISSYLIPKIKELRDRGKTIIISTHNANIAINTLPSQTVFCNYDVEQDVPIFYVGNMYSNLLINPANQCEITWETVALKYLEGSEEMFTNRRDIYGI